MGLGPCSPENLSKGGSRGLAGEARCLGLKLGWEMRTQMRNFPRSSFWEGAPSGECCPEDCVGKRLPYRKRLERAEDGRPAPEGVEGDELGPSQSEGGPLEAEGTSRGPAETQALWAGGKHRGRGPTAALILLSEVGTSGSTVRPGEVRSLFTRVCFQDVKKSRLPVLIKPSQSLGSVCRPPASQEVVAHLQAEVLKLQGELKELKIHNKQLHQKLILVEAMTEGRPAPEEALLKGKHQRKRVLCEKMDGPTARPKMSAVLFGIAIGWRINFLSCSD